MMLIDRRNLFAAAWAWLYCLSLVVGAGALDALGVTPFVTVPLAIVVLPLLVTLPLEFLRRRGRAGGDV